MATARALPGLTEIRDRRFEHELQGRTVWVDPRHVPACVDLWRTGVCDELAIWDPHDDGLKSIDFIADFFPVPRLHLMVPDRVDLAVLRDNAGAMTDFFTNAGPNALDDLTPFTQLENLGQPWTPRFRIDASLHRLTSLALGGFKPASGDLMSLSVLPSLTSLSLYQNRLQSLHGIEAFPRLHELRIGSAPKLVDVDALAQLAELRTLSFETCKAVRGIAEVVQGRHLTDLKVMACAPLTQVAFVRRLPALQSFVFMDTDVLDGDLSPLVEHPTLAHVALTRKKHFTLSEREILSVIGDREGGVRSRLARIARNRQAGASEETAGD